MCIDCNDAVFCWGLFFWGVVFAVVVFAVVFFAVVVVETWHAASLPDGTGTEQGWNRDGTGRNRNRDGTGTGAGRRVVRWLKRFANPNVGNARRMNNGFFDN